MVADEQIISEHSINFFNILHIIFTYAFADLKRSWVYPIIKEMGKFEYFCFAENISVHDCFGSRVNCRSLIYTGI